MRTYTDIPPTGVSFYLGNQPHIVAKHIDGPMLIFRDGQLHWLTSWERILFALGLTNAEKIERKRRPRLVQLIERMRS